MTELLQMPFRQGTLMLREFLGTWSLLICLAGAYNIISALKQRKRRFLFGAIPLWLLGMILLQAVRTAADKGAFGAIAQWSLSGWMILLLLLTVIALFLTFRSMQWRKTHVTPLSIQESFEKLTEGLCYYRAGGQCILVNSRMQELCRKLTGHALMNGEEFESAVFSRKGMIPSLVPMGTDEEKPHSCFLPVEDRVNLIVVREVPFEGEKVKEIVASDVTELYQKTKELQTETEQLKGFQEELQRYHAGMQENVRREEILRAKMSIHDEMNRLLLSTRNAISSGDPVKRRTVLLSWKSNALLLCKETEGSSGAEDVLRDLQVIAKSLGVELVIIGQLEVQKEKTLRLFVVVTREAMNNAVKHAGAKHVYVEVSREGEFLRIVYANDGGKPRNAVKLQRQDPKGQAGKHGSLQETGGLKNMRQKIEEAGGRMAVRMDGQFRLEVELPI